MGFRSFDQYTLLHAAVGIVAYFFGVPFGLWNTVHLIFEIAENTHRGMMLINSWPLAQIWPGGKYEADAIINSAGDLIGGAVGWALSYILDTMGKARGWYR
jgi:hypothetical protein